MSGLRGTFYKVVIKRDPLLITLGMDAVLHALASQESATKEHAMYIVARAVPRGKCAHQALQLGKLALCWRTIPPADNLKALAETRRPPKPTSSQNPHARQKPTQWNSPESPQLGLRPLLEVFGSWKCCVPCALRAARCCSHSTSAVCGSKPQEVTNTPRLPDIQKLLPCLDSSLLVVWLTQLHKIFQQD